MAKKRQLVRTRRGPKPDARKWEMVEQIEQYADWYRARGNTYDPIAKACAEYVRAHFPRANHTAAFIDRVRKSYKNACDEWQLIERLTKAGRIKRLRDAQPATRRRRTKPAD
jgi:hypothetical protein